MTTPMRQPWMETIISSLCLRDIAAADAGAGHEDQHRLLALSCVARKWPVKGLVRFHARSLHHISPFLDFPGQRLHDSGSRAQLQHDALLSEFLLDRGLRQGF